MPILKYTGVAFVLSILMLMPMALAQTDDPVYWGFTIIDNVIVRDEPYLLPSTDSHIRLKNNAKVDVMSEAFEGDYVDGDPMWYAVRFTTEDGAVIDGFLHASVLRIEQIPPPPPPIINQPAPSGQSSSDSNNSQPQETIIEPEAAFVAPAVMPAQDCNSCHGPDHAP